MEPMEPVWIRHCHRDPGDRIKSASHRDKISIVPGMLLTGILEIRVLEVLFI